MKFIVKLLFRNFEIRRIFAENKTTFTDHEYLRAKIGVLFNYVFLSFFFFAFTLKEMWSLFLRVYLRDR